MISREEAIATLKRFWSTENFIFLGQFVIPKNTAGNYINSKEGVFKNFSVNDREILYPKDEILKYDRKVFFKGNVLPGLEDGKYYDIELELEADENRLLNPYALKIKNAIIRDNHISPKDFIKQWFYKKGHTPGDAATIAGQLTLNELELYTHTKRFIFELIQNADDMPNGKKDVNIEINLLQNHLLFLHNGKFFDREDVTAISDAAKSTKSKGLTQTGYKGIGFKSVFTDSTRVFIKSGAYFFKFDKLEPIYKDFYKLYKGYSDSLTAKARKEFEIEFKGRESEFTNIDKIPWQIKPIWVEQNNINNELRSSNFLANNQVAIALEIGENILRQKDYNGMILGLLKEPRFLLFLRKTKRFKYIGLGNEQIVDIAIKEELNNLGVYSNNELIASYIKHEFEINIDNDDFTKAGLNFQKREIEGGKIEFFDNDNRKLENIPEKLGRLDKTIISLSAKVTRYDIEKLEKEDSILFNYLPTSDQRFGFPFLVNADFVSKTDREFIQIENKWNHYIFYNLGRICIEWIAKLGEIKFVLNNKQLFTYVKTYLNLLPENLLDEDNEELASINIAFNKGLNDALQTTSFIIDAKGVLKKCNEIIIDDTAISEIYGIHFFSQVSKSKKELPFIAINKSSLKKGYLNIEQYKLESLYEALQEEDNVSLLKIRIEKSDSITYFNFLKWLDNFCKKNDTDADWITSLPFIRIDNEVLSLDEALEVADFILRTRKTKGIESLLEKIGFKISEFYVDEDDYKHIFAAIYQQESYLKKDVKLFEHIAAANELNKLSAQERNSILVFFDSLEKVGEAKYSKSLALFNSKKINGSLKPLATLISNSCQNLPVWLTDFVIDEQEENSLNESFKNHLIKQKDLLEKVFCNLTTFNELINNINQSNIESFYSYIFKLHKELPEDAEELDYSQISWFYMPNSDLFALPSTVYCPDSFTKLNITKYNNVKTVIDSLSTDKLPFYASTGLKKPFSLGCRDVDLIDLLTETESFEVIAINDFLDWVQSEGEKEFFTQFSIIKEIELYKIVPSERVFQYYTNNPDLITLVESSQLHSRLALLPNEVYSKDRNKIGLLEGIELLKYLIENRMAKSTLSSFILKENDSDLSSFYIEELDSLEIDSSKKYDKNTDEYKVLEIITQTIEIIDDEDKIKTFRKKIYVDSSALKEKAISDDIRFYENKTLKTQLNIKLSEVLVNYADKTYSISEIVEKFTNFKNKGLAKIFKAQGLSPKKIYNQLNELNPNYFNPVQTFFLSFYQSMHPQEDVFEDKNLFTSNQHTNAILFKEEVNLFFDICLKENKYVRFVDHDIISEFTPLQYILDEEYAIESEKPPLWFNEWIGDEMDEDKKAFIESLGVNTTESSVVLLRKAILENDEAVIGRLRENLADDLLLKNTLHWLSEQKKKGKIILKKEILEPFYKNLYIKNIPFSEILIPILEEYNSDNYSLIEYLEDKEYHLLNDEWGKYSESIFNKLLSNGKLITDDTLTKDYIARLGRKSNFIKCGFYEELDGKLLDSNSELFEEEYYENWEYYSRYQIYIYKGSKLPYIITYNDIEIENITDNHADSINGKYYIVDSKKEFILSYFEGLMADNYLKSLKLAKADFHEKKKKEESEIRYTSEEDEALKRLFGDEIPPDFHKDLNLAALITGLVYLAKHGFNVTEAENNLKASHQYSQLTPVYSLDNTEQWTVMGRSAKTGLLYLTADAWERLESDEIKLFVTSGNNENNHHLFHSKDDVLEVSHTDFQVFRVAAQSSASNKDSILKGTFDKDKIWLIFKMKDNSSYNSIFDGGIRKNEENPDFDNINTSEESEY